MRVPQHPFGNAAKQQAFEAADTSAAHNNEIGVLVVRRADNPVHRMAEFPV